MDIYQNHEFLNLGVEHLFTTRQSELCLKVSPLTNCDIKQVADSFGALVEHFPTINRLAHLYLAGGDEVVTIGEIDGHLSIQNCDGAVTSQPISLSITVADCVPVLLIDNTKNVIGIAHGGWRGLAGGVVLKTVQAMQDLGARPSGIKALLGPSICAKCYEVGQEVADRFDKAMTNDHQEGLYLDLKKEAIVQLKNCGVRQIVESNICTFENNERFYSARKEGRTNRFLALITNSAINS